MAVPELSTHTTDPATFARILRAAVRGEQLDVALDRPPAQGGAHLLHVVLMAPQERAVWVLADVKGPVGPFFRVALQPRSKTQAAQLYAIGELACPGMMTADDDLAPPSVRVHSQAPISLDTLPRNQGAAIRIPAPTAPTIPNEHLDPTIGRTIAGKYRIDLRLGAGAGGVVYKGVHVELDRPVAIKILHGDKRTDESMVARFKAEARAASRLDHPNITRVLDFGQEPEGLLYLVMEFVDGKPLENVRAALGRLPIRRAIDITAQVAAALVRAHAEGIVHRDIKPENVMLVQEMNEDLEPVEIAKVCDFGVAKLLDPGAAGLTMGPQLIGSPVYMSPEQARGETPDPRSDIYSLGVTLFELTTGRLPFDSDDVGEVIAKQIAERPPRPSSIVADYPPALEALVLCMLEKSPAARPASARDLRAALKKI